MTQTIAGAKRAKATMLKKYGGEKGLSDHYKRIGALGGQKKGPKGFALMSLERRKECGRIGGSISKRPKAK